MPGSERVHTVLGGVVGALYALLALDPRFLLGLGPRWAHPTPDLSAYLVSAQYYLRDTWRFPLFALPSMGYPEGGSVVYNDAIPIAALVAKLAATTSGVEANYFGPWIFLCYVLQGALAARVAFAMGNRSRLGGIAIAVLALTTFVFFRRIEHIALASQFLLLWAFLVYVRASRSRLRPGVVATLAACALLVNTSIFAMVMAILAAACAAAWRAGGRREARRTAILVGACVAGIFIVAGFVSLSVPVHRLSAGGFGHYSWNLISLVVPPPGFWPWRTGGIVRDATGGQYEGDAYLGVGVLVLFVLCLVLQRRDLRELTRVHWPLVIVLVVCALFAASDRVFLSSYRLAHFHLLPHQDQIAGVFRASGRFVWPLVYALVIVPGLVLMRRVPHRVWVGVMVAAAVVQVVEAYPVRRDIRAYTATSEVDLIGAAQMTLWMHDHQRLWQYPSWFCGGLGRDPEGVQLRRETQLQLLAARVGLPNNSVYMSRPLKDCAREAASISAPPWPRLERGTLYVFATDIVARDQRLAAVAASTACRSLDWAIVCSASWKEARPPDSPASLVSDDGKRRSGALGDPAGRGHR